MNSESIMKSDVLDILFENRNKTYGAYNLRKYYYNRLNKSVGLMLAAVGIVCAFLFIPENKHIPDPADFLDGMEMGMVDAPKPVTPSPRKAILPLNKKQQSSLSHIQIVDSTELTKPIKNSDSIHMGNTNLSMGDPGVGDMTLPGDGTGTGKAGKTIPDIVQPDLTKPINDPDVYPGFPGGLAALRKFLERNLKNPEGMEEGEEISVKVKFVVGFDGKLQGFEIIQDGGESYNEEVIRVLKKMPDWIPGKSNGQNVAVYHVIPVRFVSGD